LLTGRTGSTNAEIADRQGCSGPTVRRRLGLIRRLLKELRG
jgi:DNA-binding CsgD family transcriptional regulator